MTNSLLAHLSHGALAAGLPADATRFRVYDEPLAYTLRAAGAELVDRNPDVEIGPLGSLSMKAAFVLVCVNLHVLDSRSRMGQLLRRVAISTQTRCRVTRVRDALRRAGYGSAHVTLWDQNHSIHTPAIDKSARRALAERLPRRAFVLASRTDGRPLTVMEQVIDDVEKHTGERSRTERAIASSGTLVLLQERTAIRIGIGPGARLVHVDAHNLEALGSSDLAKRTSVRIPKLLAVGRTGLAHWSVEERLPGSHAPSVLSPRELDQCIDFLVQLHNTRVDGLGATPVCAVDQARALSQLLPESAACHIQLLAERIAAEVGELPCGFVHGDFGRCNLLMHDGTLGVIDWGRSSRQQLPLIDAFQLELEQRPYGGTYEWGSAVVKTLDGLRRGRGTRTVSRYLARAGLALRDAQLASLGAAFWLDHVSHHLSTYVDRRADRLWVQKNVLDVLACWKRDPILGIPYGGQTT